jgi:hypothetical protein
MDTRMDIGKSFAFVFEDTEWARKVVIGALISLIPVIGQMAALGYMITVGRNVIRRNPQPLPEWDDFGQFLVDGFYTFVIGLIYSLPIIILLCIFVLPLMAVSGGFSQNGDMGPLGIAAWCCFAFFSVIYGVVIGWFFVPVALARYADTGDLAASLRIAEIWEMGRANPGVFLVALLVYLAASLVAGVGIIACGIGVLFTQFYAYLVIGHIYGQAYRLARGETMSGDVVQK